MNIAATTSRSAQRPAKIRGSVGEWTIYKSSHQVVVPKNKRTHTRTPPLPFTLDVWSMGEYHEQRQYLGHGKSKVCYALTETKVFKLCHEKDQEPELFEKLEATGVYPKVYAYNQCTIRDDRAETWHAWIVERAKPLNQILKENSADFVNDVCIIGAVRAMLIANNHKHTLSDNALFNFGFVDDKVVIIDAGSRVDQAIEKKGDFRQQVMAGFWSKAQAIIPPDTVEHYKKQWRDAGNDLASALETYERKWESLRDARCAVLTSMEEESSSVLNSLEECPHVASVLDTLHADIIEWLTKTYLWGSVSEYGPSDDGYTRHQERKYTAEEKLEYLISQTHEKRVLHRHSDEYVLSEDELQVINTDWKDDYMRWMRPEKFEKIRRLNNQKWGRALRAAHRSYLFQMTGSFEMAMFFIVAPFNNENLAIFRYCTELAWNGGHEEWKNKGMQDSKDLVRKLYTLRQREQQAQYIADWVNENPHKNWLKLTREQKTLWYEHAKGSIERQIVHEQELVQGRIRVA